MTQERVLLAVDSENVYRCARNVSRYIDYEALISLVASYGTPVGAWIYVARPTYIDRWSGFLVKLKFLGFDRIVVRNSHERNIGIYKSDIDMIMAMDIAEAARDDIFDRLVLVTGDSDFVAVVERVQSRNKAVTVIGPDEGTAWEMIVAANAFINCSEVPGLLIEPSYNDSEPAEEESKEIPNDELDIDENE